MKYNELGEENTDVDIEPIGQEIEEMHAPRNESHFNYCKKKYAEDVKNFNIVKSTTIRSGIDFDRSFSDHTCGFIFTSLLIVWICIFVYAYSVLDP